MKIFSQLALALFSLSVVHQSAVFASGDCGSCECIYTTPPPIGVVVPEYARTLVDTQDRAWQVATPIDPNHGKMIASGFYTAADAAAMDVAAAAEFLQLYGIDWNPATNPNVTQSPIGTRSISTIPGAIWFPYESEYQAFVVLDTEHPNRGTVVPWTNNKYGIQIYFAPPAPPIVPVYPVAVTTGVNAGATIDLFNLFSYGEFNYLNYKRILDGKCVRHKDREVIKYTTTNFSYSRANQWGNGQFCVTLQLTDQSGKIGKYIGQTEVYNVPLGSAGTKFLRENPVSTWVN